MSDITIWGVLVVIGAFLNCISTVVNLVLVMQSVFTAPIKATPKADLPTASIHELAEQYHSAFSTICPEIQNQAHICQKLAFLYKYGLAPILAPEQFASATVHLKGTSWFPFESYSVVFVANGKVLFEGLSISSHHSAYHGVTKKVAQMMDRALNNLPKM